MGFGAWDLEFVWVLVLDIWVLTPKPAIFLNPVSCSSKYPLGSDAALRGLYLHRGLALPALTSPPRRRRGYGEGQYAARQRKGVPIMMKKIGIASVVVLAGLVVLATTNLGSYARTGWNKIKKHACSQVSPEFEIDRVRDEISQLVPDMNKNLNAIAQEMVAVENLRKDIEQTRANLDAQKKNILQMREDVEGKNPSEWIEYGGTRYKADRVRIKLARDWESYKAAEASLKAKENLLEAKEQALAAAKEQMNSMKAKKEQLEVELAQLEAELKTLRVAEARGSFKIDDSRLARIEGSLNDIRDRIKVAKTEADLRGEFSSDVIPVEKKVQTADVLKEIDSHFAGKDTKELANKK